MGRSRDEASLEASSLLDGTAMPDKRNLYRLPWSMNDNPIAWLEITDMCNTHCEGCYRQRLTGHKPFALVIRHSQVERGTGACPLSAA
jgi:hypothetical protein